MADEKLNTGPGEEKLPEAPAPVTVDEPQAPAPEQTAAPTPQQEGPTQGKLIGFASVNYGGVVIDDFKVVDGKNGIFLGAPSKPDPTSRTGYRSTVRINDRATQERLNAAGAQAYHSAVEKLIARAEAVRPTPIKEQMAQAAREAGKENAARTAPAKKKEARDDR